MVKTAIYEDIFAKFFTAIPSISPILTMAALLPIIKPFEYKVLPCTKSCGASFILIGHHKVGKTTLLLKYVVLKDTEAFINLPSNPGKKEMFQIIQNNQHWSVIFDDFTKITDINTKNKNIGIIVSAVKTSFNSPYYAVIFITSEDIQDVFQPSVLDRAFLLYINHKNDDERENFFNSILRLEDKGLETIYYYIKGEMEKNSDLVEDIIKNFYEHDAVSKNLRTNTRIL